jgi:hypothetical protein
MRCALPLLVASALLVAPLRAAHAQEALGEPPAFAEPPASDPVVSPAPLSPPSLFRRGVLVSVDDVLPVLAVGSATSIYGRNALQIGETTSFTAATTPRLPFVDGVFGRFTVGGTLVPSFRVARQDFVTRSSGSYLGLAVRGGVLVPLGDNLTLWPRLGLLHERSLDTEYYRGRTLVTADARLAWALDASAALTFGVAAQLPLSTERDVGPTALAEIGARDSSLRLSASFGVLARLDEPAPDARGDGRASGSAASPPTSRLPAGTVILGMDRFLEVLGLETERVVRDDEPGKPPDPTFDQRASSARVGLVDARGLLPRVPRLSVDVLVSRVLTVGASGGIGVATATASSDLVPTASGAPTAVAWTLAPRVGALVPLAARLSLWPRIGGTWAESHGSRGDVGDLGTHQVSFDADAYLAARITSRFLVALGPSVSLPLWGRTDVIVPGDARTTSSLLRRGDLAITSVGLGGMVGLTL